MAERPLYTLYKGLKANNYDVPSSYDSFEKTLVEAGNGGANARHTLFNSLKSQGYDVPDTYESFYRTLFTPVNKTTSRAIGGDVPMSEADKRRFSAGAANISAQAGQTMQNAGRYNKLKSRQKKQKNDFGRVSIGTHKTPYGGDADNVVKDDFAYNPETGKAGTYVNSDSEDAYNLGEAEQKQVALDQQNQAYQEAVNTGDIPSVFDVRDKNGNYDLQENVGKDGTYVTEEGVQAQYEKKLADAYARKKELEGMIAADNEKNGNPLLSYSASVGAGNGSSQERRMMDAALNQVKAEINSLEAVTQTDKNAWYQDMQKALENTAFTAKTWAFGINDFALMGQLERIKAKMDQNIPLNGMEQTLLKSKVGADAAAALEDDKMGFAYRWTKIAGQSLPFMVDFFLTGGYGGITKATSNAALKFAAKKGMGKLGAAILKNTGVVGADIISSYAMAGTEQAMKTGADIMQRHMGNLYQDENGNYKFGTFDENGNLLHEGGEGMGKALYKGMTAAMLENYTEKIFGHNYGLKKGALKFMENHGMARSAEFFKNIGQKEWYAACKKWMEKFGYNGYAEEVMEEEINIPLNALLVGDNKMSDLLDPKQQLDIIGGMALSVGSMYALGAGTRPLKGVYNRAQYYRYKNKVNNSDTDAYTAFGSNDSDKWEALRDKIDNAPNEKMGGVLASIIASRDELTKDQIDAAVHYGINLMKMRGYNLAKTEEMNAKEMTGETATPEEQHDEEVETAYSEGHDAEDADKHNIQMEAEDQMTTLAGMLGITEQQLSGMTDEELDSLTGQDDKLDQAIYDYQLSTARYQGVVDNANDKVEAAAQQASHQTDMLTDKSRGTVRNATVIGINGEEDYGVYIISGKLATHEDGAINIGDSDSMIIYYDPKTQSVEHADARRFVALGDEVPAEEVKAQAIADAKEAAIKAEAGIIDGTVEVGTQFSTTDADGTEHTYEVLADNGDGTAMITVDGNVEQNPYTFEELQTLKDAEDLKRLNAAKAQRGMLEEQQKAQEEEKKAQQQKEDEQKNAILEQITNADGNVQLIDVIDENGDTKYPGSQVFLISEDGAKAKIMVMDADGNLKPYAVNKEDIVKMPSMTADEYRQTQPASNIEEDRGEIEAEEAANEEYTPITDEEADAIIADMESRAEPAADIPLTPENWESEFGEDGTVQTPIGEVKMGENQIAKLFAKGRSKEFGMIKPTLENPDIIIEVPSNSADGNEERASSYLFVKTFLGKNGKKIYYFKSVTIKKEGLEISVSSHYDRANRVKEDLKKGKLLYRNNGGAQTEQTQPSASVTTSQEGSAGSSEGKGTNNSAENNENNETLTLEDGTVVPMMEDGNPDFSQLTAEQTAELYDSQFGEDAEQIISGFVSEAKKALDKATNMTVKGKNFAEQKTSKAEKDKAISVAQTAYDSAKAIADAYAERQLRKELDTHEGRMNLIQKAKNKFSRLKNKEEWKNNPYALWNETVGKVLHRLYDGTSVDVFDTIPLTVEEYVSSSITPFSLNFEGKENSKGVAAETGLQRKDFAKSHVLAAEGKGKTVDEFVHKLWNDRPKNLENVSDQDIRTALLDLITSNMNAYDMSHVIEDNRIAQAEEELENDKRLAENAQIEDNTAAADNAQTVEDVSAADSDNSEEAAENNDENASEVGATDVETVDDATDDKPLGEQVDATDLPFSVKDGKEDKQSEAKGNEQYDRAADVEKNLVSGMGVVDDVVGRKTRKAFDRLAKMMGAKIQWQYSDKLGNGWYDEKVNEDGSVERTIYLTLDSSIMEGAQFIFGHEMTHEIKSKNPVAYEELRNIIINTYGNEAFDKAVDETEKRYRNAGVNYAGGRAAYEEEVVADGIGEMIRDLNLAHTLALKMSHPLLAYLHEILMKIKRAFYDTEYSDRMKEVIRGIEQAYVKTAKGDFEAESGEAREEVAYSLREKEEPKKKGIGYKVFLLGKDGKLYPPMVANPNGAATPVGVWLDADAAPIAGESKTGRPQVKQGGKGTQGGSGKLAYRPGWHLGVIPYALQFNRKDADGNKTLFPKNFVFAEVEYAADVDYQQEAHDAGINPSGKYQHSLAGLKHLPTDGYYMYRTNPNPETDPWVITGAMKVNRILTRAEQAELVKKAGREPQMIQDGDIVTDEIVNAINQEIANAPKFSLKVYHGSGADFTEFDFDHMGEGAGSQAFGWGGYVTTSKKIGKSYAKLIDNKAEISIQERKDFIKKRKKDIKDMEDYDKYSKRILKNRKANEREYLAAQKANDEGDMKFYKELIDINDEQLKPEYHAKLIEGFRADIDKAQKDIDAVKEQYKGKHNMYEVDIPDDNGNNYLNWSEKVPSDVLVKIGGVLDERGIMMSDATTNGDMKASEYLAKYKDDWDGRSLYIELNSDLGGQKEASKLLSEAGLTGIKYPAGTIMGGAEEGDINYVIFKPEDMQITKHTKFSIKTYHGSQASFDHFDHSFMGSGEGAQAYGWGTYVSEVKGIAKAYAKQNTRKHRGANRSDLQAKWSNEDMRRTLLDTRYNHVLNDIDYQTKNREKKQKQLDEELKDRARLAETYGENSDIVKESDHIIAKLQKILARGENTMAELAEQKKELEKDLADSDKILSDLKAKLDAAGEYPWRNLYTVEIPDDTGDNYIGWDSGLSENAAANIAKGIVEKDIDAAIDMLGKYGNFIVKADVKKLHDRKDEIDKGKMAERLAKAISSYRGGAVYDDLANVLGGQKNASLMLKEAGIDGVKVIAQRNTGGNKQGKMNYVIFDENNANIVDHEMFSLKNAKPVRFEVGKSLSDEEKKEVLATLKDAYKENNVSFHTEESANGKERRVYEPTAEDYVKSDITGRALRYYITLPDGRIAHPTEVYPNISNNEVETSLKKRDVLGDEVKDLIDGNVKKLKESASDIEKATAILTQLQDLEHETTDVGYGLDNPQSYNYKTGVFTSNADQAIGYVVRRMRRKEEVTADVVEAVKTAVKDSYGMVDNLIDGLNNASIGEKVDSDAPKTFEEFLESPSLKFQIRNEEQRKAAESAYNWAVENRPDKWNRYALVNMANPQQMPEYYEKKALADKWRRYENKVGVGARRVITDFKLFDLNKPFEENVVNVKGKVPEEFDPHKFEKNREEIAAINKQKKELNEKLNALEEVRRKRMNDILKQYMDEHHLSSEYEVPDDVWMGSRRTANDEYTAEADKVIEQIRELEKKLKSLSGNDVRYSLKGDDFKKAQLDIINETNPMLDDYHTGIRKVEDIKTFQEAYDEAKADKEKYGYEQMSGYPDLTDDILDEAAESGEITVYSSKPIENGNFVTPSRMQAEDYSGGGKVYEKNVPLNDVAWIDVDEGQYAKVDDARFSIKAYHGSGAKFDNFDLSHALEGEGSETFGHGVYVTNSGEIGADYAKRAKGKLSNNATFNVNMGSPLANDWYKYFYRMVGNEGFEDAKKYVLDEFDQDIKMYSSALEGLKTDDRTRKRKEATLDEMKRLREQIANTKEEDLPEMPHSYRYDVDIPDDNGTNYLDWGESIKNISLEKWAEMYDLLASDSGYRDAGVNPTDRIYRIIDMKLDTPEGAMFQKLPTLKGEELYHALEDFYNREEPGFGAERASECLSKLGFAGIKYKAGMIHGGAKEGDYNYVIFKEDDAKIVGNTKFSLKYNQFEKDLEQWKKDNGLKKDAQRPAIPTRDPGESAVDFMKKVNEYRRQMALWKTAPTYEGHLLTDGTAQGEFSRELQRGSVLKRIAFQDSMLAIRKAQEAIMKEYGVDKISMAEDAYTAENRSHGKGKNELEEYNDEFLQPLRKAYKKMKDLMDGSYDNVKVYMMAKHGLERNAQMAFKKSLENDFENVDERVAAYNGYKADVARMQNDADLNNGRIDYATWRQRDNGVRTKYAPSYPEYRYDKDGNIMDYSGLTALFEGTPDIEVAASDLVKNAEDKYSGETADLWNAVNAATKKILRDSYKAGMMSEKVYEYVRDMYKNYIPLRGWNETQADQVWDYIGGGKGAFNQTLKEANGRTSIADDPIAYIENMAESGILINNKNWVKQHLMLLAENHPTSLLTLSKAWYVKSTDAAGNETWIPASPQITSGMTNQQVEAAVEAFQKKMEKLEETGDATQQRGHLEITYPQTGSEEREHEVRVMKDGEEYVIYVNGDPQLAQAMNNTRAHRVREVQSGKLDRACAWLGRKMAAAYTSLSPLFIPSNYFRDLTMTLASTAIREDGRYNYLLRKNLATSWNMWGLLKGYKDGTLREKVRNGNATEKEQMFYDFMMNGGETGFVSSFDVEDLKKKFKGELKDMDRWAANPKKVLHTIYDSIEFMNRAIENSNRFAVYMTSIQYGRSIEEAVNNAKDVTLNFNRKGTGENGWQMIRNLYLFINPAVQSLQTLGALAKHHPYKFTAVTSAWMVSGALVPLINEGLMMWANMLASAFGGGDDDDEYKDIKEKYWQFSKWDRRNNLIMWVPFTKEFVKIPLAQEFRGFYAVGDMIASKLLGGDTAKESWGEYAEDLMGQVVDMLPLDPTGYDGNIAVSLMPNAVRPMFELAFNVDFTGKPLFKDSEYNKYDPNFTKAYAGTPDWLVRVSRMVNSIGNDYPDVQQNNIDAFGDPRYNLNNPAVVDHVLSSYLGGAYTMGSQVMGVLTKALNDPKEIKVADIPLVSKFVSNPEDRPVAKKQGDEFWTMKENHDRVANTLSKLKKKAKVDGDYSLLEQLYGSEEYKQYKLDDAKVKKYEEDKKKEKAEETGEEYKPHQRTADDVYKEHSSAKDELEDLKMKQIYSKLNSFKTSYDLLVKLAPKQSDGYYNTHKVAIDAVNAVERDKKDISDTKKDFLTDGVVSYDAEKMQKIRGLRKKVLVVLEKANKELIVEQQNKDAAK